MKGESEISKKDSRRSRFVEWRLRQPVVLGCKKNSRVWYLAHCLLSGRFWCRTSLYNAVEARFSTLSSLQTRGMIKLLLPFLYEVGALTATKEGFQLSSVLLKGKAGLSSDLDLARKEGFQAGHAAGWKSGYERGIEDGRKGEKSGS